MSAPVTDLRDVRVLIPPIRRAIDGPTAQSSAAVSASLTDDQVMNLAADSIGDVILFTGNVFGKNLEVMARDPFYQAPTAWQTSVELTEAEKRVIVAQAAINYFFQTIKAMPISQTIQDEAQTWTYDLSATLVRDQLKLLTETRDRGLEALSEEYPLDAYISFLQERDAQVANLWGVEHWTGPSGSQGGMGGMVLDPRGFF